MRYLLIDPVISGVYKVGMKWLKSKALAGLFLTLFVVGQWELIEHVYEDHPDETLCELCLAANSLDHAIHSQSAELQLEVQAQSGETIATTPYAQAHVRYYAARAPPYFL